MKGKLRTVSEYNLFRRLFQQDLQFSLQRAVMPARSSLESLDRLLWNVTDMKWFHGGSIMHQTAGARRKRQAAG
jgi:hypothetical protein